MTKDLIIGAIFFLLIALGYYYFTHTAEEIITHIIMIFFAVGALLLLLAWGKTALEELEQAGSRAIRNFFNPTTPILGFTDSNTAREFANLPPNDRDFTAKASTEPSTAKFERIEVTESKSFEVLNAVTEFMTHDTKGGKLWLDVTNPINHNLINLSQKCKVHKAVIIAVIKRYPDEFKITSEFDKNGKEQQFAYSVTAFEEKLRATQAQKNSTEVVFESTSPTPNSTPSQSSETKAEVYA